MATAGTPEQPHVYVTLLRCMNSLDVDWKKFAAETGIKAKGNAQRKLNGALKKDGLQLLGGKIVATDTEVPPTNFKSPDKRKIGDDGDEEETVATPTKKPKAKAKATPKKKASSDEENCDEEV